MTGADAEACDSYTTPVLSSVSGHPEMIVMGGNVVDGYDPATGKRLWQLPGLLGGRTVPSPTVAGGFVYVTAGFRGPLSAVKLGGHGLLERASATAWQYSDSTPDTCSPVVSQGHVFMVSDLGIATCLDARTGKRQWRERLGGRGFKASPVAADGHVYFLGRDGRCTVVEASGDFRVIDQNSLDEEFTASPAISDGRIYLRGRKVGARNREMTAPPCSQALLGNTLSRSSPDKQDRAIHHGKQSFRKMRDQAELGHEERLVTVLEMNRYFGCCGFGGTLGFPLWAFSSSTRRARFPSCACLRSAWSFFRSDASWSAWDFAFFGFERLFLERDRHLLD